MKPSKRLSPLQRRSMGLRTSRVLVLFPRVTRSSANSLPTRWKRSPPTVSSPSRSPRPLRPTVRLSRVCSSTAGISRPIWSPIPIKWKRSSTTLTSLSPIRKFPIFRSCCRFSSRSCRPVRSWSSSPRMWKRRRSLPSSSIRFAAPSAA